MAETSAQTEQMTQMATAAMRRHKAESKIAGPKVVMPGGRVVSATSYLQDMHRTQKQATTFSDIDEHPEKYLKDPRPGWRYVWVPKRADAESRGRIMSGAYVEVGADEMLDDCELPFVEGDATLKKSKTHTGVRKSVEIYDVKLCAVSPKAWKELFQVRESMAVAKIASDTESFYDSVEREGAVASMQVFDDSNQQIGGDEGPRGPLPG